MILDDTGPRMDNSGMSQELFGRIVCVRSPLVDGSGWLAQVWFVAVDDDQSAVDAVYSMGGATTDDEIIVIGQLEPDAVQRIGLKAGQALSYP